MQNRQCKIHNSRFKMQDARCKMQDARCKMQDARCKMQDARCKMQGARSKVKSARCKIQNARCKMQDAKCKMQDTSGPHLWPQFYFSNNEKTLPALQKKPGVNITATMKFKQNCTRQNSVLRWKSGNSSRNNLNTYSLGRIYTILLQNYWCICIWAMWGIFCGL